MKRVKRFVTALGLFTLAGLMVVALSGQQFAPAPMAEPAARTAYVHLFEWRWSDIANECEAFLGPNGYDAVQISPPNEHAVLAKHNFPWWQRYQPVSYKLVSRSGDRAQLIDMIQRCHRSGVKIYADAVINHMAAIDGVGSAGTRYTRYQYPGLYDQNDFNSCRRSISDYNNFEEVTTCELVALPDLNTALPGVRDRLATYLADLHKIGVDGFRIDAAKHIKPEDLAAILARLTEKTAATPYVFQEVIDPGHEAVKKRDYYAHGDVTEFEYGRLVSEKFLNLNGQTISQLETLGESWGLMPSDEAVVFIDNHDKQRGHGGGGNYLTYKNGELYTLANVFMLAFPYGYPQVMSSYAFDHSDQGPPTDANGETQTVFQQGKAVCDPNWMCEHRRPAIAGMVGFRNATAAVPQVTRWWSNGSNQIAFGRGDRGYVVINRESAPLNQTLQTDMPAGTYCNVIDGKLSADGRTCTGSTVRVNPQGEFIASMAAMNAIAIHAGARVNE